MAHRLLIMRLRIIIVAIVALLPAAVYGADLSGRDVIMRMFMARAQGSDDAISVFRLDLASRDGGQVTRTVATYRKQCGEQWKNLVVFRAPADVAGAALLTSSHPDRADDMWVYLPELGRVRQVNASTRGETFMGTDFSYEDLGAITVDARQHRLAAEGTIEGEEVYKVQSTPTGTDAYGKVLTWVSRRTFLPVEIDYYDQVGALLKSGHFRDVREVKGIPTPFAIEIENVETGHRTLLTLLEADYHRGLDCELFNTRHLTRAP